MKKEEFNLKDRIRNVFAFEEQLDIYFPKGDKRRGEVLALLGIIHCKVSLVNKEFIKKLKESFGDNQVSCWFVKETIDKLAGDLK